MERDKAKRQPRKHSRIPILSLNRSPAHTQPSCDHTQPTHEHTQPSRDHAQPSRDSSQSSHDQNSATHAPSHGQSSRQLPSSPSHSKHTKSPPHTPHPSHRHQGSTQSLPHTQRQESKIPTPSSAFIRKRNTSTQATSSSSRLPRPTPRSQTTSTQSHSSSSLPNSRSQTPTSRLRSPSRARTASPELGLVAPSCTPELRTSHRGEDDRKSQNASGVIEATDSKSVSFPSPALQVITDSSRDIPDGPVPTEVVEPFTLSATSEGDFTDLHVGGLAGTEEESINTKQETNPPPKQHSSSVERNSGGAFHSLSVDHSLSDHETVHSTQSANSLHLLMGSERDGEGWKPSLHPLLSRVRAQLREEGSTISLPQLEHYTVVEKSSSDSSTSALHRPRSMPQLASEATQVLACRLQQAEVEKDAAERQLRQARETVAALEGKEKRQTERVLKADGKIVALEDELAEMRRREAAMKEAHRNELVELQQRLRAELDQERERLLSQIRELARMNSKLPTKKLKQEHGPGNTTSQSDMAASEVVRRNEKVYQMEIEALQSELASMQELFQESEHLREAMEISRVEAEERVKQLLDEKAALQCQLTEQASSTELTATADVHRKMAQQREPELESECSREKRMIVENVKLQVEHKEAIDRLQAALDDSRAALKAQEERIQGLQEDLTRGKGASLGSLATKGDSTSSSGRGQRREPGSGAQHQSVAQPYGRWTSYRADVRKHAEEMLLIVKGLTEEGCGPSQATGDEMIRHLWRKKEHLMGELTATREKLKKTMGAENYKALQECQERLANLESELIVVRQKAAEEEKQAASLQKAFQRKLDELIDENYQITELLKSQDRVEPTLMVESAEQILMTDSAELTMMIKALRKELMDKTLMVAKLEADLSSQHSSSSELKSRLSLGQHQSELLQTQLETVKGQLTSREEELVMVTRSHGEACEGLTRSEAKLYQSQEEAANLQLKVAELENEISVRKQNLSHMTVQRDTLLAQLETISAQLSQVESNLNLEKANSNKLQSMVERLSEDLRETSMALQQQYSQREQLDYEASSLKGDLCDVQQQNNVLEIDFLTLRDEYNSFQDALLQASITKKDLEQTLTSTQQELHHLKTVTAEKQTGLVQDLHDAVAMIESQKESLDEFRSAMELSHLEKEELEKRVLDMEADRSGYKLKVVQVEQELEVSQKECHCYQEKAAAVEKECALLINEVERLQNELRLNSESLVVAESSTIISSLECESLKRKLLSKEEELEEAKGAVYALDSEKVSITQQREETLAELQQLKHTLEEKRREFDAQKSSHSLDVSQSELKLAASRTECQTLQERVVVLEDECLTTKIEVQNIQEELKLTTEGLSAAEESDSSLNLAILRLTEELSSSKSELDTMKWKMHVVESERDDLMQAKTNMLAEIQQLRCSLDEIKVVLTSVQTSLIEKEESLAVLQDEKTSRAYHLSKLQKDHQKMAESKHSLKEDLLLKTSEVEAERENLLKARKEVSEIKQQLQSATSEVEELKRALVSVQERAAMLEKHATLSSELVGTTKAEMQACQCELNDYKIHLSLLEGRCKELKASLDHEIGRREFAESESLKVRQCHDSDRHQIQELSRKVKEEVSLSRGLEEESRQYKQEIAALTEQMQLERKQSFASFGAVQGKDQEETSQLGQRVQQLTIDLREAQSANHQFQGEMLKARITIVELNSQLRERNQTRTMMQSRLKEEASAEKQRLELLLKKEREAKESLIQEQSLQKGHIVQQNHQIASLALELTQLQTSLLKEKEIAEKSRTEKQMLTDEITRVQQQIEAIKLSKSNLEQMFDSKALDTREAYHSEQRELKEQLKTMHLCIEALQNQQARCQQETTRLSAINQTGSDELERMNRMLEERERVLEASRVDCHAVEERNMVLSEEVDQLKASLQDKSRLMQYELKHHKKRALTRTRSDLQRIVAEVTMHMEQQYTSHKYIEQLRAQNESLKMNEKDREMRHLKCELERHKRERQQDALHMQSLEFETKYLHTRERGRHGSRERLQSRLEQVNEALSKSAPAETLHTLHDRPSSQHSYELY